MMQTEYFDIMLLHWQHNPDWLARTGRWQDGILEAQSKKTIRTREHRSMACPRCARCPATNGWKSR